MCGAADRRTALARGYSVRRHSTGRVFALKDELREYMLYTPGVSPRLPRTDVEK